MLRISGHTTELFRYCASRIACANLIFPGLRSHVDDIKIGVQQCNSTGFGEVL